MCVCVRVRTLTCVLHEHADVSRTLTCVCMWWWQRLASAIVPLSSLLLFLEAESLMEPGAPRLDQAIWSPSPQDTPVLPPALYSALGLQSLCWLLYGCWGLDRRCFWLYSKHFTHGANSLDPNIHMFGMNNSISKIYFKNTTTRIEENTHKWAQLDYLHNKKLKEMTHMFIITVIK